MTHHHKSAQSASARHRVVIVGGGFGGLYAAKHLGNSGAEVLLIDRRNFHLFQPLLYQVATGGLSPGDISSPLRAVLKRYRNIRVIKGVVSEIDAAGKNVLLEDGSRCGYDTLILAAGTRHHYFGNPGWERRAPGLKTIEDALEMRRRIFQAFESAEREPDPDLQAAWLTFLVIGGGPTGVELAGALAELAYATLKDDFRRIDPRSAKIILLEGSPRILSAYPETLSQKARRSLEKLGVEVRSGTLVVDIREDRVTLQANGESTALASRTVLWGAGVQAAPLGAQLAETAGVALDNIGRVTVDSHLNPEGHPEIFVIGDLARCAGADGAALPGVAPVAMQQGRYAARMIRQRLRGRTLPPFRYVNKGNLAVIGRNAAVADLGYARFSGWPAWLVWVFVHIAYLIEFANRVLVLFQWAMNYITRKRGARLITGERLE